jgi:CheY-like chemotaxis protein/two-component sensor histidine kinase
VAHELNNPLAVVVGRAALVREKVRNTPLEAQVGKIAEAAERCARIVKNFLALARQRPPERQETHLNDVVREAVELLAYPLRVDNVEVTLDLAPDLPVLWADLHQLHQVVINLVTNAHQAMRETVGPRPSRLTLTTRREADRGRVWLEVADTGPGIPPEIQSRIFEPFFTTKPPGQGTGLGLSLCHGVVESHGGTIGVRSRPGEGAVFRIELPVTPPPAPGGNDGAAESVAPATGRTVLVVDDEVEVARLLAEMLSADGHRVETAANGAAALDKLRERAYDLILSDLRMPELDGPGLYRALEGDRRQLQRRMIFLTGDTLGPETREFLERSGAPSVSKPFALQEVRRAVQHVLERATEDGRSRD